MAWSVQPIPTRGLILSLAVAGFASSVAPKSTVTPESSAQAPSRSRGVLQRTTTSPDVASRARVRDAYGKVPLSFEMNRGQTDPQVNFISRGPGYTLFLTATDAVLSLPHAAKAGEAAQVEEARRGGHAPRTDDATATPQRTALRMRVVGANPRADVTGRDELPGKVNYLRGNDPSHWQTGIPTFAKVRYADVYPGIDLVYYGNQRRLEYDFVVAPGADPADIRVSFSGMEMMRLDSTGDLVLTTDAGEIRQHKPFIYQDREGVRHAVAGGYVLVGTDEIRFAVAEYDATRPLVIDPVLAYSTYLGGNFNDEGRGIAVDADGNAYIAGVTSSPSTFPRVGGISTVEGGLDAFVSKLNATGDSLVYSTFLGHAQSEAASAIAVDDNGEAYVTGYTRSPGFPTTPSRYQAITAGNFSAFVTRLNAAGNALVYSTFLGGNNASTAGQIAMQEGLGIAIDSTGHAYVTGWTNSVNFPHLIGFQATNGGQIDAFLTKLNTNASGAASLVYSTYLGGGDADHGVAIAVGSTGSAYVTGRTASGPAAPFPTTFNPLQGTLAGGIDAFVAKLDTTVSGAASLVYSTYLGGSNNENQFTPWPGAIAVDSTGHAYVTGGTNSGSASSIPFPTTPGAYQETSAALGQQDAFLTKLNPAGTARLYSTFFGGGGNDVGRGVAVDSTGHVYVTGEAGQPGADFPIRDAAQPAFGGGTMDAFVAKIDPAALGDASLVYSTFLGVDHAELAFAIALDSSGNAYVTGKTNSAGLSTAGAFQTSLANTAGGTSFDAFVAKLGAPTITEPDLVVTAVTNPPAVLVLKQKFTVTDTTENQGTASSATTNRFYLSLDTVRNTGDKLLSGKRAVPVLSAGGTSTGPANLVVATSTKVGVYYLLACADDLKVVTESDEGNNCRASTSTVEVRAADLTETAVSNPPATAAPGGSFAVTDTVGNAGNAAGGASTTRYYFSLDTKKAGSDPLLTGTRAVPALGAGASSTGSVTVTIPSNTPAATYYLLACGDDLKKVAESNEKNNCKASATKVVIQAESPSVSIVDFSFMPSTLNVTSGSTVKWTNNGAAPHTTTSSTGVWNSGTLAPGAQFSVTFTAPGTYGYQCAIHPSMTASIVVQ